MFPTWVPGTEVLGPSSTTFSGTLAGHSIGSRAARIQTSTPVREVCVSSNGTTHCSTVSALEIITVYLGDHLAFCLAHSIMLNTSYYTESRTGSLHSWDPNELFILSSSHHANFYTQSVTSKMKEWMHSRIQIICFHTGPRLICRTDSIFFYYFDTLWLEWSLWWHFQQQLALTHLQRNHTILKEYAFPAGGDPLRHSNPGPEWKIQESEGLLTSYKCRGWDRIRSELPPTKQSGQQLRCFFLSWVCDRLSV